MPHRFLLPILLLAALRVHGQLVKNTTISREILFDTGSSRIDTAQERIIAFICNEVTGRDNYRILLKGNTDSVGTYEANLALSLERAKAVKARLAACGVNDSLIGISGVSFTEPKVSNSTDEGKAKNRRTKIILTLIYFSVSALEPVEGLRPGSTLDLNVLFQFNSDAIKESSQEGLMHILQILQEHPGLQFEIRGWSAISQTNDDLAGKRAKAVYEFLLAHGIPASRMTYKSMGGAGCASNSKLLEKCRRVEIAILRNPYLKSPASGL